MEVADQWRREWAGTAEYGKVTEGGVTRRVARAMEVLHASGPGARMRVMRAAYHSSAGPGAPAESFMLHSSRRVISSGFNFLESPSLPSKPLEISSTPLELTFDSNGESENYKVTEPDDLDISEPSKWRGSTRGSSIRMPSEESSSADNASIIDLDSKSSRNLHRKYSYDSESSEVQFRSRSNSRTSQLLDTPALSTLKYKSLLNSSNEWNTRRKSYSFEDTSPLNETILHTNDTLAMESSTDSGICKSTEIMNDHVDDNSHIKYFGKEERKTPNKEESFKDWLSKNRQNSQYRGTKFKTYREHDIVIEDPKENNIALQSSGKVSITLPITIEGDEDNSSRKAQISEEAERRVKKVEFCKTEVHFAAESGKVNIIATDEKPPPSNDFRKRRSAFVPMQDMIDRPITLFGEKNDFPVSNGIGTSFVHSNSDFGESDENTAATKSILKNKIPKPKPYLLGENMDFGILDDVSNKNTNNCVLTAVSLVNQQLESEKQYRGEVKSTFMKEAERNVINSNIFRTINAGPTKTGSLKQEKHVVTNIKINKATEETTEDVKNKLASLHVTPSPVKPKTRQLRDSDLTYFGIDNDRQSTHKDTKAIESKFTRDNVVENIFHSVKLIQQVSNSVSNSVCNSEPESEEAPEYQNIPLNMNYAPVPTPRQRSKYDNRPNEINEVRAALKPIVEKESDETKDSMNSSSRRARHRRQEETKTSRSISEPPKHFKRTSLEKSHRREEQSLRSNKYESIQASVSNGVQISTNDRKSPVEDSPIYANLNIDTGKLKLDDKPSGTTVSLRQKEMRKIRDEQNTDTSITDNNYSRRNKEHRSDSGTNSSSRRKHSLNQDTLSSSLKRESKAIRTEKAIKSHNNSDSRRKINEEPSASKHVHKNQDTKYKRESNHLTDKKEHSSRSLQTSLPKSTSEESGAVSHDHNIKNRDSSSHRKRNSSKDKINSVRETIIPSQRADTNSTSRHSGRTKGNEREKEYATKSSSHKSNKHREYVLNYDDKNGTFSSVSKIKPSLLGTPRRKKTSKEIIKENHKDNSLKIKNIDKIALRK
ncbi:uncharacterized protein LOC142972329 isoform X2 [Anticarsia gemmatalis]|uniref:uncharacterized protein LOC142972329 isoform X2 n=1 Tax=Anticarsia gemmatalis TaxID=129554 RepID=UPI003F75F13F